MNKFTCVMSAPVERRPFATQLSQGILGVLGLGVALERVEAYEVSQRVGFFGLECIPCALLGHVCAYRASCKELLV